MDLYVLLRKIRADVCQSQQNSSKSHRACVRDAYAFYQAVLVAPMAPRELEMTHYKKPTKARKPGCVPPNLWHLRDFHEVRYPASKIPTITLPGRPFDHPPARLRRSK
ncbi:hypothetical protein I553_0293 [Mycobacterium xenopi 4042]|uniref:Uncharacterized protein n=1 Tax=Mycobacterium xenopi 4042 TaxID=1299334 RepID=X7YHV7_MYCXE|nr:hypothetical protein I553_0293 [Mycobacterium xenopi 4042]